MLLSVHLRRGDKIIEEWQNNFTFTPIVRVAQRIRQEVSRIGLTMDAVQVHIMFDDSKAAGELVSRLNLAASAVAMRPVGAAPANGFAVSFETSYLNPLSFPPSPAREVPSALGAQIPWYRRR